MAANVIYRGAWQRTADAALRRTKNECEIGRRMRLAAEILLGRPYLDNPLVGGPDRPEEMVVDLSGFDCVTFIESVLALSRSRSRRGFTTELRELRYRSGVVGWRTRLHYFSDWMTVNHRRGAIHNRTRGAGCRVIETSLGLIEGFPCRRVRLPVVPKREVHKAFDRIVDGSVVAFASTRARLDFFHNGLVFRGSDQLMLCHASRTAGAVIEEPLTDFLGRNRMRGIAFAAPLGPGGPR